MMNKKYKNGHMRFMLMLVLLAAVLCFNAYGADVPAGNSAWNDQYDEYEYEDDEFEGPGVILYRHADFRGTRLFVRAGRNIRDLARKGWNDKISSIELVDNAYIRIYEHAKYRGASIKIYRDVIDLVELTRGIGGNWNDKISSIKVFHGRDEDDEYDDDYTYCTFYKHANRRGSSFEGRLGRHRKLKKRWNDEVSSVWIRSGCRVILYEHAGFRGRRLVLEGKGRRNGSVYNLDRYGFNDRMSSYKVERLRRRRGRRR
jgi:hypothetical protein